MCAGSWIASVRLYSAPAASGPVCGNRPSSTTSVVLVAVVRWIAADVYSPNYPDKSAYNVPGAAESAVDLALITL